MAGGAGIVQISENYCTSTDVSLNDGTPNANSIDSRYECWPMTPTDFVVHGLTQEFDFELCSFANCNYCHKPEGLDLFKLRH